jgi:hypothetical protein
MLKDISGRPSEGHWSLLLLYALRISIRLAEAQNTGRLHDDFGS